MLNSHPPHAALSNGHPMPTRPEPFRRGNVRRNASSRAARRRRRASAHLIEPLEDRKLLTAILSGQTQLGAIDKGESFSYTYNATAGQSIVASLGPADLTST